MFRRIAAPVCVALFALAGSLTHAASANAAVGAFVIHNPTSATINYTVQWSDGDVQYVTLEPGESYFHSSSLDSWGLMPTPTIMFDATLNDEYNVRVSYELTAYRVSNPRDGKDYTFSRSGYTLDLHAG